MLARSHALALTTLTLGVLLTPALQAAETTQQMPPPEVVVETVKVESLPLQFEYPARTCTSR